MPQFSTKFPNWPKISLTEVITNKKDLEIKTKNTQIVSRLEYLYNQTNYDFVELLENLINLDVSKRWDINQAINSNFLRKNMNELQLRTDTECSRTLALWHQQELFQKAHLNPNYLENNKQITPTMRRILIDWIIEVHFNFKHMDTTLNMSIYLLDKISLNLPNVTKNN